MMELKFTKQHLYEIEKVFDYTSTMLLEQFSRQMREFDKLPDNKEKKDLINKVLLDYSKSYNDMREIVFIASNLKDKIK